MTERELAQMLDELESDRVERKPSDSQRDKIRQAICAFANDLPNQRRPGVIFIGVNDDGSCAQLPISDELLRNLGGWRSDGNILSSLEFTIEDAYVLATLRSLP